MKVKRMVAVAVAAGALGLASLPASASFFLTNSHGTFEVDEFDWASNGVAWTNGFVPTAGTNFTLFYADYANSVNLNGSTVIDSARGLDNTANGVANGTNPPFYEYTIFATLNETVDSCTTVGPNTTCTFTVNDGSFDIYYDTTPDAHNTGLAWSGFQNGIDIISGSIASSIGGSFVANGGSGTGGATLFGTTTSQNFAYVNPTLDGTTATTTLQIGMAALGFTPPTSVDGTAIPPGQPTFKGDSNQLFTAIPEPGSLALIGLALGVSGFVVRRRRS
jgi:hypothetical protein